jgi:dihydroxyacetone kinase
MPILNGLGSVKYEELFVVYRRVAQLLADAGIEIVDPQVGELVTSFDMAGASLTLFWLDDELETLWTAPADAPAFRRGNVAPSKAPSEGNEAGNDAPVVVAAVPDASEASRAAAGRILSALQAAQKVVDENADELGRIDAVAGDGDHGIGMQRGVRAAVIAAEGAVAQGAGALTILSLAGDAWADKGGGTSGALWGTALAAVGEAFGNSDKPDVDTVADGISEATAAIMNFGKAQAGDKTMVDVLLPFRDALTSGAQKGLSLADAWGAAATVAEKAAEDTAQLLPRIGRARPHAEKSLGTPDAGAVSLALIIRAIDNALFEQQPDKETP